VCEVEDTMTSEKPDPVEIVRAWYTQGVIPKNMPVILSYLHEDVEWWCFGPPGFVTNGYYRGHQQVVQFFQNLAATLNATSFEPYQYHGAAEVVTAVGLEQGTIRQWGMPESNQPFFNYWVHMFYVENGKVRKFRANYTVIEPNSVPSPVGPLKTK